jgi:predicted nucleotidyltransferase
MVGGEAGIRWHELTDEERGRVREGMRTVFADHPWVTAAWHFGSSATGGRPARDIDVGILAATVPTDLGVTEALAADLASTSGFDAIPFDVRIVNGSSPVFLGRLLRQGSLVFERDREARIEWEAMAMSLWLDFRPVWERMRRQALRSWARG